jgi:hypothetical protein
MKKIKSFDSSLMYRLIFLFLMVTHLSFSQNLDRRYHPYMKKEVVLKEEGWKPLTLGIISHTLGTITTFTKKDAWESSSHRVNFFIFNTVGLGLDLLAFEIKTTRSKPRF